MCQVIFVQPPADHINKVAFQAFAYFHNSVCSCQLSVQIRRATGNYAYYFSELFLSRQDRPNSLKG